MNKITAQEAQSIVKSHREQKDPQDIEKFLNFIYEKVSAAAKEGRTQVEVELKPYMERHKDTILKILRDDGYRARIKVYTNWMHYHDEYVRVSWDT